MPEPAEPAPAPMRASDLVQEDQLRQVMASLRPAASALGGALVAFGVITASQNTEILAALQNIGNAAIAIATALGALAPVYASIMAYRRSSNKAAIERVQDMPVAIQAQALAERGPVVEAIVLTDQKAATDAPSPKVTSTAK